MPFVSQPHFTTMWENALIFQKNVVNSFIKTIASNVFLQQIIHHHTAKNQSSV